jgi:hypothetical protein
MAKRFLESHGLPRGVSDDLGELAERIRRYEADGKLSHDDVDQLLREVLEFGEKRVHLFRGDAGRMRAVRPAGFGGKAVDSLAGVGIQRRPTQPTLNYALLTSARIRLCYSETHVFPRAIYAARTYTEVAHTRIVVVDADLGSGIVSIAFDSPGEHQHGANATSYFSYYIENEAPGLLDTQLVPLEYFDRLLAAERDEHRALVRPAVVRGFDAAGLDQSYRGQGTADLRDYETFRLQRASLSLRKSGRLTWKATDPKPTDLRLVRSGGALLREVTTTIQASPAVVRFGKHTLSHEMTYVLRTLRSLA